MELRVWVVGRENNCGHRMPSLWENELEQGARPHFTLSTSAYTEWMRESVLGSGLGFIRDFIRFSYVAENPHHSEVVAELGTADGIGGMKSAAISRDGRGAS